MTRSNFLISETHSYPTITRREEVDDVMMMMWNLCFHFGAFCPTYATAIINIVQVIKSSSRVLIAFVLQFTHLPSSQLVRYGINCCRHHSRLRIVWINSTPEIIAAAEFWMELMLVQRVVASYLSRTPQWIYFGGNLQVAVKQMDQGCEFHIEFYLINL